MKPSQALRASSPKGRAFGRPGSFRLTAEGVIWRKKECSAAEGSRFGTMFLVKLLLTQIADMHHDGAVGDVEIRLAPHGLVDDLHREDALGALHQQLEDLVLGLGQVGLLLVYPDPVESSAMRTPSRMSGSSSTIMMVCIVYDLFPVLLKIHLSISIADFLHCGQLITYFLGFVG